MMLGGIFPVCVLGKAWAEIRIVQKNKNSDNNIVFNMFKISSKL